jgi:hypothetical protein
VDRRPLQPVLSQHSELRNTDVFSRAFTLFFLTPHSGQEAQALKCSNALVVKFRSKKSSLPETLTHSSATHFLGSNSLVVRFRSKTVFLPLKFLPRGGIHVVVSYEPRTPKTEASRVF